MGKEISDKKLNDEMIFLQLVLACVVKSVVLCTHCLPVLYFLAQAYASDCPRWGWPNISNTFSLSSFIPYKPIMLREIDQFHYSNSFPICSFFFSHQKTSLLPSNKGGVGSPPIVEAHPNYHFSLLCLLVGDANGDRWSWSPLRGGGATAPRPLLFASPVAAWITRCCRQA
jgi:hypothetical protein